VAGRARERLPARRRPADAGRHRPGGALAELEAGLGALGRRVEEIERIVVTHQHIDHCGLAATLVARSGAELCALAPLATWMEDYPASAEAEDDFEHSILERHGAPGAAVPRGAHRGPLEYSGPVAVSRRLADGDVLEFGRGRRARGSRRHRALRVGMTDVVVTGASRGLGGCAASRARTRSMPAALIA
jgi:glyoxylase-like metal-dependent hydrolase (beta-lactamase superfamily II)